MTRWHDGRIRVVFVDHVARLSGGEIALFRLLPELSKHVDVHVILGEDGPLAARLRSVGVAVEVLPLEPRLRDLRRSSVRPAGLGLGDLWSLARYVWRLRRRLRELDADLVHTNSLKAALYAGAAGRLAGMPVVWHVRDRIAPDYLPVAAVRLVRVAARVLPTTVVANSNATLDTLPRVHRSRVLYNPVVPDAVERPAHVASGNRNVTTVGLIGRLAPWKGQHVFLDAFAQAFRGSDVRARIVGSAMFGEDAYADELRRRAERLGVADHVEFLGFREDIWAVLAELDVLVHCSVTPEPFGQVVLEGMAAGLPVIASAAGGAAELVTHGADGLLVPPGDVAALATAMKTLCDDRELRRRLGLAARASSFEFRPERTVAHLREIYRVTLQGSV